MTRRAAARYGCISAALALRRLHVTRAVHATQPPTCASTPSARSADRLHTHHRRRLPCRWTWAAWTTRWRRCRWRRRSRTSSRSRRCTGAHDGGAAQRILAGASLCAVQSPAPITRRNALESFSLSLSVSFSLSLFLSLSVSLSYQNLIRCRANTAACSRRRATPQGRAVAAVPPRRVGAARRHRARAAGRAPQGHLWARRRGALLLPAPGRSPSSSLHA